MILIVGVEPVLSAKDMADVHVEHLGVMAYAAHFQWLPERPPLQDLISCTLNSTSGRLGDPVSVFFVVEIRFNDFMSHFEIFVFNFWVFY